MNNDLENAYERMLQQQALQKSSGHNSAFGSQHPMQIGGAIQHRPASFFDVLTGRAPLNGINRTQGLLGALQSLPINDDVQMQSQNSIDGGFDVSIIQPSAAANENRFGSGGGKTGQDQNASSLSGPKQIENNAEFAAASDKVWAKSKPNGPKNEKREIGFYAVARWSTGLLPTVTTYAEDHQLTYGAPGEASISRGDDIMYNTPNLRAGELLIQYHTHPFTKEEGHDPHWHKGDQAILKPNTAGVIRNHFRHEWYGMTF